MQETHIDIGIPLGNKNTLGLLQKVSIPGLHYRPLLGVLKSALADVTLLHFHFSPFKRFWKKPCGCKEHCFNELYTSDAWLKEHDQSQHQPNEPGCKFKELILGLMLWSDSTHLANFGSVSGWPLYLYFGNSSKYFWGKLGLGASHHIAYISLVSTCLCNSSVLQHSLILTNRFLTLHNAIPSDSQKASILTHCCCELMHGVWTKLPNDKFVKAYHHGFTMKCLDGVWHCIYP